MRQAYTEAASRCENTGLTLLLFDGGSSGSGDSHTRAGAEAVLFESGLRQRDQSEPERPGGRLLPRIGTLVANLSNASLARALSSLSVVSLP